MIGFTPQFKHHILQQYQPYSRNRGYQSLARLYGVTSGGSTIRKWMERWNGTITSLQHKKGAGRPRLLSSTQVNNSIRTPIKNKRRVHLDVHYTQLLPVVRQKSGTQVSLRTLQYYGQRDVKAMEKHTIKRTSVECQFIS